MDSIAMTWAVYGMCKHPEVQDKLRAEVSEVLTDTPTYENLVALPYLDAIVRETLRVYSPILGTVRVASEDSMIPLSEALVDVNGRKHGEILYVDRPCNSTWGII